MQREQAIRAGRLGLALSTLSALAGAQGFVATQGEVVAATLDPVPGVPGAQFAGPNGQHFGHVVMDENGNLFFRGGIWGGTTSANDKGIFFGKTKDDLALIYQDGDPAPGLEPLVLNSSSNSGISSSVRISADGRLFFTSGLGGGGVVSDNDTAIFAGFPGAVDVVAREGGVAPGTANALYDGNFTSLSTQFSGINGMGVVIFQADLEGGDTLLGVNEAGLFSGPPGQVSLVLREGDTLPDGSVVESLGFLDQLGHVGQILHCPTLSKTMGVPANDQNDRALYISLPGTPTAAHFLIAREGDPAPGTQGAFFSDPQNDFWNPGTSANCFSSALQCVFTSELGGGDASFDFNDFAIFIGGIGGVQMVVRRNDPAPGTTSNFGVFNNSSLLLNSSNQIAFQASLQGTGTNDFNNTGIWVGSAGNLELVVREGDPIPGVPDREVGNLTGWTQWFNDLSQLVFTLPMRDPDTQIEQTSLWTWSSEEGLRPALMSGDQIEIQPGVFKTVANWGGVQFNNGNGAASSFNHEGQFALRVGFTDGMDALVRAKIGNLVGAPEGLSVTDGGTQELFLDAGADHAGDTYLMLGSATGTSPGISIDGMEIPLVLDSYTDLTLLAPNSAPLGGFLGLLDADGKATASWTLPAASSASFVGLQLWHAYVVIGVSPTLISIDKISQPALLEIIP